MLTAGLFASACGSDEVAQQTAATTRAVERDAPDIETERDVTPGAEPSPAATPDEAAPIELSEDPLFFGEYASLAGEPVDLAEYAGEDVVLWFWAPW